MTNDVSTDPRVATASDFQSYVREKIGAHLEPVPRRVLLSEIQTDAINPFDPRTIHHDLMGILCVLESSGDVIVGPTGLELAQ